jgi:hypothetical protein
MERLSFDGWEHMKTMTFKSAIAAEMAKFGTECRENITTKMIHEGIMGHTTITVVCVNVIEQAKEMNRIKKEGK